MGSTRRTFLGLAAGIAAAQEDPLEIYREPPRLFLTPQRLRRLKRDSGRNAQRWEQFAALAEGGAQFPEPGFSLALYSQVTGDPEAARKAVAWAAAASDARQIAIVYDWCQAHAGRLKARLEQAMRETRDPRAKALAAIALGDEKSLAAVIRQWWRDETVPAIMAGRVMPRDELYFTAEVMHAVRDNTGVELRDPLKAYFYELPRLLLAGYYPAVFPAAENDYRVPATRGAGADLRVAALARCAELALIAYDTNMEENQYLQGWAMHDRFMLRSAFGAPYELLWANPYQPGLSYDLLPTVAYDSRSGQVFARSGWEDGAEWLGWLAGELQIFAEGRVRVVSLGAAKKVYSFRETAVVPVPKDGRLRIPFEAKTVFLIGVERARPYRIEPDGYGMDEVRSDAGGTIRLEFRNGFQGGITVARQTA